MKWVKFIIHELLGHLLIPVYFLGLGLTSAFLLFEWILTLVRQKTFKFKNRPYFKERSIFSAKGAKEIVSNSRQKSGAGRKIDYRKLNEGLGGAYERVAYTNILKRLAGKYGVKKVLELNSTYIAGVPAFNSSILAQSGFDLTITVHRRDYRDARHAWDIAGLANKVKIVKWDDDFRTPFKDGEFDLVWNHLAVEHYHDPAPLLTEMKRLSKHLVVTMTLSPFNLGFVGHFLWHKLKGKPWDHGYIKNTLISTMEKYHREVGLTLVESGGCDDPTSPDTVDGKMGESMTYLDALPKSISSKWVWTAINPKCQTHPLVKVFWFLERGYPEWFRRITAHHLYTASAYNTKV